MEKKADKGKQANFESSKHKIQLQPSKEETLEQIAKCELGTFKKSTCPYDTEVSRQIKIACEVEKIWILYDVDGNGSIDFDEVAEYLNIMAAQNKLTKEQVKIIFDQIDKDGSGSIDK